MVTDEIFNKYKDNVVYRDQPDVIVSSIKNKYNNTHSLPWIRYPRTKDGVLIPLLIEKIFTRIPSKIVFISKK